ncbi:hypothetical protein SYJ56_06940 [Algoriphagus sp. D3-2-R+10]|uniref:hypothetical protein n=1 Tax=Algoriphagus aurantiacus TaxID=3103948 RepID=UPI002B397B27|nr:hypothetical protein [Algoriphagus sp. D3-2-R+10]MEB2775035.1 hypothetical protein [Algoriphagus sp. D3-2-R+10]
METLRIKAYPKNKKQIKLIADFFNKEGIEFDMVKKEEFLEFMDELESSLNQVQKIQKGELKKEKARDFLNEL